MSWKVTSVKIDSRNSISYTVFMLEEQMINRSTICAIKRLKKDKSSDTCKSVTSVVHLVSSHPHLLFWVREGKVLIVINFFIHFFSVVSVSCWGPSGVTVPTTKWRQKFPKPWSEVKNFPSTESKNLLKISHESGRVYTQQNCAGAKGATKTQPKGLSNGYLF